MTKPRGRQRPAKQTRGDTQLVALAREFAARHPGYSGQVHFRAGTVTMSRPAAVVFYCWLIETSRAPSHRILVAHEVPTRG